MKKGKKVPNSYKELKAKADELMRQAEAARSAEIASVVSQIKQIMNDYGVTLADLRGTGGKGRGRKRGAAKAKAKKTRGTRGKVPPKYRDPATGLTWSGRGKEPTWLVAYKRKGKKREDFAI